MKKITSRLNIFVAISIVCIMVGSAVLPSVLADNGSIHAQGFAKGVSWQPVVPLKKTTFVNFDEDSLIDDYAYLAAIPTAVFQDKGRLFSFPLLFYQDEYPIEEDRERSLNARQGLDYFMEDWMSYCNGRLDQMTLINVPKSKLDSGWRAKDYNLIDGDDPYSIASQIALSDWSYSDDAVVAVIGEEFERLNNEISGMLTGEIVIDKPLKTDHFEVKQTNRLNPVSHEFTVPEGYMYVYARCWYPSFAITVTLPVPGFEMSTKTTIPSGDKDLQLYCMHNGEWMQTVAMDAWNQASGMDREKGGTYVYNTGRWRASVTDVPTKRIIKIEEKFGTWLEILRSIKQVVYQVDISMYPGVRMPLFDNVPFGCKDVTIELTCKNPDVNLGFCLMGPGGEEILSDTDGFIEIDQLGECLLGESYDIAIYTTDDVQGSFNYEISYSWNEDKTRYESDCLTDATEGAILASTLNAPLLYTSSSELPKETIDALNMLGVNNIYLVNLGDHLSKTIKNKLTEIATIKENYKLHREVYNAIRERTGSNDVIFSTTNPWRPWFVWERKATEEIEMPYALFVGPAAYCAAHHGSPVLVVDNHPELSSAVVWHNEFWNKKASYSPVGNKPTVAEMHLTGTRVYDFLKDYGFDKRDRESIITVAGQFNIGAAWDRVFIGKANCGRFFGSPVDTAYWISRNVFYPALIFVNPATDPNGVEMINGSVSHRRLFLPWGKRGLIIDKPSREETIKYPVVSTFLHYEHRFNERASKYWGFTYQCADGLTPGEDYTTNPIDQGVSAYIDEEGSLFPDMSMSDVIPAYLKKGGYGNAFSTSFPAVVKNVNNGVLLWMHFGHGFHGAGGLTQYWFNKNDPNPWRMYEFYLGSTEEPDTLTIEIHGILPALLGNPDRNGIFRTALDWAPAKGAIRDKISTLLSIIPIIRRIIPEGLLDTQDYYDGMINTLLLSKLGCTSANGTQVDDSITNLHSAGYITNACLMATKYIHLALIRHGSSFQIMDPWPTSWYGAVWTQSVPRDIILGDTVGEAFTKGISHVGILYISDPPQWWWDNGENVCYYGDPDLRIFVPGTDYSDANHWEKEDTKSLRYNEDISIDGHMPFGATGYPHERKPEFVIPLWVVAIIAIVLLIIVAVVAVIRKKAGKK